jgi:hypothetical protein
MDGSVHLEETGTAGTRVRAHASLPHESLSGDRRQRRDVVLALEPERVGVRAFGAGVDAGMT